VKLTRITSRNRKSFLSALNSLNPQVWFHFGGMNGTHKLPSGLSRSRHQRVKPHSKHSKHSKVRATLRIFASVESLHQHKPPMILARLTYAASLFVGQDSQLGFRSAYRAPQSDVRLPGLNVTSATSNLRWVHPVHNFSEFPITIGSLIQSIYVVQRKSRMERMARRQCPLLDLVEALQLYPHFVSGICGNGTKLVQMSSTAENSLGVRSVGVQLVPVACLGSDRFVIRRRSVSARQRVSGSPDVRAKGSTGPPPMVYTFPHYHEGIRSYSH
jgi:hypothetical protein